jgi:uncharacterized membrane protein YGL010W
MKEFLRQAFDKRLAFYRSQHMTLGCKITHMVGVPIIALSFPVFFVNRRLAGDMQKVGWTLQLIGHYVFEHNKPVFMDAADPLTALAALVFVADEWQRALKGESISEEKSGQFIGS